MPRWRGTNDNRSLLCKCSVSLGLGEIRVSDLSSSCTYVVDWTEHVYHIGRMGENTAGVGLMQLVGFDLQTDQQITAFQKL